VEIGPPFTRFTSHAGDRTAPPPQQRWYPGSSPVGDAAAALDRRFRAAAIIDLLSEAPPALVGRCF
jgi:hypothetical protein